MATLNAGSRGTISRGFKGQAKLPPVKLNHKPKMQSKKKQGELKRDIRMASFGTRTGAKTPHILDTHFNYDGGNGKTTFLIRARSGH